MNRARKLTTPVSNPSAVMRIIENSEPKQGLAALVPADQHPAGVNLKLHVDSDLDNSDENVFRFDEPPGQRSEQLLNHLRNRQKELIQREADLQAQTYQWETQVLATEASLRKRGAVLEQHLTQVACQQEQLMKLQQNLVDSQQAIRAVVERLVDESTDVNAKMELAALRDEVGQRFDDNFRRWEHLVHTLNR